MEPDNNLEIYIPKNAEVTRICLQDLPKSILTCITKEPRASQDQANAPEGVWISPVVVRVKGQSQAPEALGDLSLELYSQTRSRPGRSKMRFVSFNQAAYNVLKNIDLGSNALQTSSFPRSPPPRHQEALIVYGGHVYLSIRRPTKPPMPKLQKELLDDCRPETQTRTAAHSEDKRDATQQGRGGEVSAPEGGGAQPAGSVQGLEETTEQLQVTKKEVGDEDARRVEAPRANPQSHFDFNALEEKEKIAQMRAKYQQSLKNLPPS